MNWLSLYPHGKEATSPSDSISFSRTQHWGHSCQPKSEKPTSKEKRGYFYSTLTRVVPHTAPLSNAFRVTHKALVSELKPTFHKSCSFGNVVQQLVEDGSDGLFSQHEVLQWRDGSFCHAATATKVTRKWPQRSAHPSTCRHRHLTPGHSKEVTNKPERLRTPGRLV